MKAAALSIDITPPVGLPIGGNVRADNKSIGVHDNLFCNIILLEDKRETVCFLSFDLLGLHFDSCRLIKSQISTKTGLNQKNIVISSTHTHSGPDVLDFFKEEIDSECVSYIKNIAEKVADGVRQAFDQLQDMQMRISKKAVDDLSFNRRLIMKSGSVKMNWEYPDEKYGLKEAGPIDPDLFVIALSDAQCSVKALILNFTLHPAVLVGQDWLWSRDFINYLDEYIKRHLGDNVVVFFANGAEGNINHIDFRNKNQGRGFKEAERIGKKLGEYVLEALDCSKPVEDISLVCVSSAVKLPYRKISEVDKKKAEELLIKSGGIIPSLIDGCPDEIYAQQIMKMSKRAELFAVTEMQTIRFAENIVIITMPGEVFVEFGLKIKEISECENTLVFGLTNDCIGYVPTRAAFRQGGYEIRTATSSQLDELAGEMLINEIKQLLARLH